MIELTIGIANMIAAAALLDEYLRKGRWWLLALCMALVLVAFMLTLSYVIDDTRFVLEESAPLVET